MNIIYATKRPHGAFIISTSTPILKFTDTHRIFRRYRNLYELLTEMPRFKHCTISFHLKFANGFNQQSAKRYLYIYRGGMYKIKGWKIICIFAVEDCAGLKGENNLYTYSWGMYKIKGWKIIYISSFYFIRTELSSQLGSRSLFDLSCDSIQIFLALHSDITSTSFRYINNF